MANYQFYGNLLTTAEAAKYLGVSYVTMLNYVKKGLISAIDLSHGTGRAIFGFSESILIDFDARRKKIKKTRKSKARPVAPSKEQLQRDLDYVREITLLRSQIKMLSNELLDISIKLDELSK